MLEARGLAVTPPGARTPVVRDVTLSVASGEWLAIAGGNGGGKTSLALALAGLWPLAAGTLTLDGAPLGPERPARTRVACVLQDPASQLLQPTVAAELAFALENLAHPPAEVARRVAAVARRFGLAEELARDPHTLSAGRQQLVGIAAAVALEPALLVADEATAHLDPAARAAVLAWLTEALAAGMTAVWVSQETAELEAAHRVLRLGGDDAALPMPETGPPERGTPLVNVAIGTAPGTGPIVHAAGLAFTIAERGITALTGPNGAGKSVLLGALAGVLDPPQVEITWSRPCVPPPILTLQYPELQVFEEWVRDEVRYAACARGRTREAALAAAAREFAALGFEPDALFDRRTWELSTGAKRLVEVVAALVAPAGIVLLDEPTAGLDPGRRAALASRVRDRARTSPVVVASQDRAWIDALGADVQVLGGRPERVVVDTPRPAL
jgi:energy-coupling factor transporter ATP-binding protein EcfA2